MLRLARERGANGKRRRRIGHAALARDLEEIGALLAQIEQACLPEGVAMDGLVGFEMFRRLRVTIDYAGRALSAPNPGARPVRPERDVALPRR